MSYRFENDWFPAFRLWALSSIVAVVVVCSALLVSSGAHAGAGRVTVEGWGTVSVPDSSCQAVGAAFLLYYSNVSGIVAADCTADPVVVNNFVYLRTASGSVHASGRITSSYATPPVGYVDYQPQIDGLSVRLTAVENAVALLDASKASMSDLTALQSQVGSIQTAVMELQNGGGSGPVLSEPYDYSNGGMIFSAVLITTLSLYFLTAGAMRFHAVVKQGRRIA